MLAILARSGQYLPVCLTFGPTNGPEDFAFATDRVFAPGRGRRMRFCQNWQIYADDITVRSGRWIDGTYYTDGEKAERLKAAKKRKKCHKSTWRAHSEAWALIPRHSERTKKEKRRSRKRGLIQRGNSMTMVLGRRPRRISRRAPIFAFRP